MPKKQLEVLVFEKNKINVTVSIDYIRGIISLVKPAGNPFKNQYENKEYVFVGRNENYINIWLNILDAMAYAMKEAKKLVSEEKLSYTNVIKKKIIKEVGKKVTKKLCQ